MKLIIVLFLTAILTPAQAAGPEKCRVERNGDTLRIANNRIERAFLWNDGNLQTLSLSDLSTGSRLLAQGDPEPDFSIGDFKPAGAAIEQLVIGEDDRTPACLVVRISFSLGTLDVRREYVISDDVPAIACRTYLKGRFPASPDKTGTYDRTVLDRLSFRGSHWHCRVVRFHDVTDSNNNLVEENDFISYRTRGYRGNIFFARDAVTSDGFFFLKEAPCSDMQIGDSEYDFTAGFGEFRTVGAGLCPGDVSENEWTRVYGCVTGVTGKTELEALSALRAWQKTVLKQEDIIMMNTWGDRSQDAKIGESFCLEELEKAARLGITIFQVDDGWQCGKSPASIHANGSFDNIWRNPDYWKPDPQKYPRGLDPVIRRAEELGIQIGLWFNPSVQNEFEDWEKDAAVMTGLYEKYGIRTFKIDGLIIPTKKAEINLRKMLDSVIAASGGQVRFNLDVTAGKRIGYQYFGEYGNLFLENRYTDWGNYYPCYTLRNLWQLSRYVPAERLQIEFLNPWRNRDKYPGDDPYAPGNYSFEYLAAISLAAQPLAWMEASNLPEEAFAAGELLRNYSVHAARLHSGTILPVGDEPSGSSWTGFQSIVSGKEGYLLVFREDNAMKRTKMETWFPEGRRVRLTPVAGAGRKMLTRTGNGGTVRFMIKNKNSFAFYRYEILD